MLPVAGVDVKERAGYVEVVPRVKKLAESEWADRGWHRAGPGLLPTFTRAILRASRVQIPGDTAAAMP